MKNKRFYYKQSTVIWGIFFSALLLFASCDKMEESYEDYLQSRIYSPRVNNLQANIGFKTVVLMWDNPTGTIAKKIILKYDENEVVYDEMINSVEVKDLEIKGYDMMVFTEDAFGNRSVPASIYVFPNGEE